MRQLLTLASLVLPFAIQAQWTPMTVGTMSNRSLSEQGGDLYCASFPAGIKKSIGGTGTWTAVNTGLPSNGSNYYVQSVGTDGTNLYAGTESGVYRSTNNGTSWTNINGTLAASNTVYANKFFSTGTNFVLAIYEGTIAQGGGIWRTLDNGANWLIGHSGMTSNAKVNNVTKVGNTLWASTSVGLFTSTDNAQNWTAHPTVNYAVFGLASGNGTLVIASTFGMRYSTNNGTSWQDATGDPASPTDGEVVFFDGRFFTVLNGVGCLRSENNGAAWTDHNTGFGPVDASAQEEFLTTTNTLYCTALFDVYSLAATNTAVSTITDPHGIILFPTAFDEVLTLRGVTRESDLLLIDGAGRTCLTQHIVPGGDQHIDRNGLAAGTYRALLIDRRSGQQTLLGAVVAR
ncbi:MAG TPA: hypothetical protein PL010_05230 [Flavobacteriales bacterium]|nr:hypothetical protein [Flavobacteriales bacterium]HMZ47511.1 hypothetical protein [Flavobacteriales bacterium]HNE79407.1 hypothetical protein [Flavobacteriales bacterium]HNI04014.1 hypothetical protein [Flavobacteriales bacterium]HNO05425.1 hypothetical protein [Flavobacteriales bacterium]